MAFLGSVAGSLSVPSLFSRAGGLSSLLAFSRLGCFMFNMEMKGARLFMLKDISLNAILILATVVMHIILRLQIRIFFLASPVEKRRYDEDKDILSVKFGTLGSVHCICQVHGDDD